METLEQSRVCRLCGKSSGLIIKIFDKRGNHVKKINSVLPIVIHEMDLLPKHMCPSCNFKLHEFHKFYENCLKTDAHLKSQLSWMQGSDNRKEIMLPMVQISNVQIKTEPPDYDEGETTDDIYSNKNLTNFPRENCTTLPEGIFQSTGNKCSRCGCYCGNRNRVIEEAKSFSKTKPNRHNGVKKSTEDFLTRDTIRRNLFAAEIFGDENAKIQTEIPICNIPREILTGNVKINEVGSGARLERLDRQQNGAEVKTNNKMAEDSRQMATRTLRSRKRCRSPLSNAVSSASTTKRSKGESKKSVTESATNVFATMKIKLEKSEDCARSLRPRMEAIDYSYSKRKNPLARANVFPQRTGKPEVLRKSPNNIKIVSAVTIKLEKTDSFTEIQKIRETRNNFKRPLHPPKCETKSSGKTFDRFPNGATTKDISSQKRIDEPKSRPDFPKNRMQDVSKRKNSETIPCIPPFCLRSQRIHLRSGKMKQIDSFVQQPKKIHPKNVSRGREETADSKKQKQRPTNGKSFDMSFKHRDCDTCKARFASSELYMLHGCYAN